MACSGVSRGCQRERFNNFEGKGESQGSRNERDVYLGGANWSGADAACPGEEE